jgi:hypothetical protein
MNPEEESLYAEMRAAIRGDQERAAKRAHPKPTYPISTPTPQPAPSGTDEPKRPSGLRRLFGGRRDPT